MKKKKIDTIPKAHPKILIELILKYIYASNIKYDSNIKYPPGEFWTLIKEQEEMKLEAMEKDSTYWFLIFFFISLILTVCVG